MNDDLKLARGVFAKEPAPKVRDFIKANLSIKLADFGEYVKRLQAAGEDTEWINLQVKVAHSGKWYVALDTWKPKRDYDQGGTSPAYDEKPRSDYDNELPF